MRTLRERANQIVFAIAPSGQSEEWHWKMRQIVEDVLAHDRDDLATTFREPERSLLAIVVVLQSVKAQVDELIHLCSVADAALREARSESE